MLFTDIENVKLSFKSDIEYFFQKYSELDLITFQRCHKKINKQSFTTLYLSEINIKKNKKTYKMFDFPLSKKNKNKDLIIIWEEINKILSNKYNNLSIDNILIIQKNNHSNDFNTFLGNELVNKIKCNDIFNKLNTILPLNLLSSEKTKV